MDKRKLENIVSPYTPDQIVAAAKTREPNTYGEHLWFTSAWIANAEEKVLVFDIHSLKDLQTGEFKNIAGMRVFIGKESFITRVYTGAYKSNWITGTLVSITGWHEYFKGYVDVESMNAFREFFQTPDVKNPIDLVYDFQARIGKIKLAAEHARIIKRIDAEMSLVPEIPTSFGAWVEEIALYQSRYVFYRYEKGRSQLKGYCTHCNRSVIVVGARHNTSGICPACTSKITYKAIAKTAPIHDREHAYLIQKMRDGRMVLRVFFVYKSYGSPKNDRAYLTAASSFHEIVRGVIGKGTQIKWYEWTGFKSSNTIRWCEDCSRHSLLNGALYTRNLHHALHGTKYQYSGMYDFAVHEPGYKTDWTRFLLKSPTEPAMEYLIKAKLFRLTEGLMGYESSSIDRAARRLHQALGVMKDQIPMLQKMDISWNELRQLKSFVANGIALKPDEIRFFSNASFLGGAIKYVKHTTPHRLIRYAMESKENLQNFFRDWYDYLKACDLLEIDTHSEFILFPKNFREAHDSKTAEAAAIKKENLDRIADKKFAEFRPLVDQVTRKIPKKFSEYRIVCPEHAKDIRDEGTALHHCVGNYVERVARGETMILFVRAAAELGKSLYTVEFRDGQVVQCRGRGNSMEEPVPPIVLEFTRWFEEAFRAQQTRKAEAACA